MKMGPKAPTEPEGPWGPKTPQCPIALGAKDPNRARRTLGAEGPPSPPQELEGGVHSAPNFNFTSQGGRRAPIW